MTVEEVIREEIDRIPGRTGNLTRVLERGERRRLVGRYLTAAVVASVVAGVAALVIALPDPAPPPPVGTPEETVLTTPETEAPVTTSAGENLPETGSGSMCEGSFPFAVQLPEDFTGPVAGPSPQTTDEPAPTQAVAHWIGRGGSVELRWPADPGLDPAIDWGTPGPPSRGDDSGRAYIVMERTVVDGVDQGVIPQAYASFPLEIATGPCDVVQVDVLGPATGISFTSPDGQADPTLGIVPHLSRPADQRLIASSLEVQAPPPIHGCEEGEAVVHSGPDSGLAPASSAPEALMGLLATHHADTWPKTGYLEYRLADGSIVYGKPVEVDPMAAPTSDAALVVSVTVTQGSDGWVVDSWSTSGC